jgi:molecular chaperone GrpE (heat shock protein)
MAARPKRVRRLKKVRRELSLADINRAVDILNERARLHEVHQAEINELKKQLQTQFTRIAQLQQEIDQLKKRT